MATYHIVFADGFVLRLALGLVRDAAPVQDHNVLEGRLLDVQRLEEILENRARVRHDAAQGAPLHHLRASRISSVGITMQGPLKGPFSMFTRSTSNPRAAITDTAALVPLLNNTPCEYAV